MVISGGDGPLKRSLGFVFLVAVNRTDLPYGCRVFSYFNTKRLDIDPFLPSPRSCGRVSLTNTVN